MRPTLRFVAFFLVPYLGKLGLLELELRLIIREQSGKELFGKSNREYRRTIFSIDPYNPINDSFFSSDKTRRLEQIINCRRGLQKYAR